MKALLGVVALVVAVAVISIYGCGPRGDVARDSVIAKIDDFLGKTNVKRAEIERQYRTLIDDLTEVSEKRINAKVRIDQLEQKKKRSEEKVAEIVGKMKKLQGVLQEVSAAGQYEKDGKTWTAEQLDEAAKELEKSYASEKAELETNLKTSLEAMQRAYDFLDKQEKAGKEMKSQIESKLEMIDSRRKAAENFRSAQSTMGGQTSITEKYKELNTNLDDLFVDVESAMQVEEGKLSELNIDSSTSKVDELLAEPADLNSTMNRLDAILGGEAAKSGAGTDDK